MDFFDNMFIADDNNFSDAITYFFDNSKPLPNGVNGQTPTSEMVNFIEGWDTSRVTNMVAAFSRKSFNSNIGNWDTSNVTNMADMFSYSAFNQNIGHWDVSKVTNFNEMFASNNYFNQNITYWNTSSATSMVRMFNRTNEVNTGSNFFQNITYWNVSNIPNSTSTTNTNPLFEMFAMSRMYYYNSTTSLWLVRTLYVGSIPKKSWFNRSGTRPVLEPLPSLLNIYEEKYGPIIPTTTYIIQEPTSTLLVSNICFPQNTNIILDQGEYFIEDIDINKHTINNKKIKAVTKTISKDKYLLCIEKDALSEDIPSKTTYISKNHKLLYNGKMYKANELLNKNEKIYKVEYNGEILYNILLEEHSTINVNNLICETLHPENEIAKLYLKLQKLEIKEQEKIIKKYNKSK